MTRCISTRFFDLNDDIFREIADCRDARRSISMILAPTYESSRLSSLLSSRSARPPYKQSRCRRSTNSARNVAIFQIKSAPSSHLVVIRAVL